VVLNPSSPLLQGVQAPDVQVAPEEFYPATRRMRFPMRSIANIAGLGSTDPVTLRQTGIVAYLEIRVTGTIVFGGTIAGTSMSYLWPFGLINEVRLSANGQSNLVKCRGLSVRAMELVTNPRIEDNGLGATFGSTAVTSGTMKFPCDDWGTSAGNSLNPGATVAATGTYTVDLTFLVPVTADAQMLIGSVYAQSSATNLTAEIQWETQANLLTLGGAATFAHTLQFQIVGVVYSIPNVRGRFVVPDLSLFHQLAEFRISGLGQNLNELNLPGTGAGRKLLRLLWNIYTGTAPGQPLPLTAANYNTLGWAYGGADVPEAYANGHQMRAMVYRDTGVDLGANWGIGVWDFASIFALRDAVDEGATSDLRIQLGLVSSPTNGAAQVLQETVFAGPAGA